MSDQVFNKFRAAIEILQRGRDSVVETLAEEVLSQEEDLLEGGFLFNEFLEAQGTRLHFLGLLVSHLEQSADAVDEAASERAIATQPEVKQPRKRKSRAKKITQQASTEGQADDN